MAKIRAKVQGKLKVFTKKKKKDPNSTVDMKKIKSMEKILGSSVYEVLDEIDPLARRFDHTLLSLWKLIKNARILYLKDNKVKITMDDIEEDNFFWNSSIVCYVLGANPPLSVLESSTRRLWKEKMDKVGMFTRPPRSST
uniref:Uncharacterized protein n=1 Tax=Cannabis sativa TaxID=3483 RepID=A0A803Q811_CANSA